MLLAANWKAYVEDLGKARGLFMAAKRISRKSDLAVVLAPPATFLGALALRNTSPVAFCAQDVSATAGGAETGETTARMSASAGATYAIIGHSERRAAGDTNAIVAHKLAHAFACDLTPILCVGEPERDNDGRYLAFLREEIASAYTPFTAKERSRIIIAYEPIWAIGKSAEDALRPDGLTEMVLYIRKILSGLLPGKNASRTTILYGGSVEPDNVRDLAAATGIDGFLIGHAAAEERSFVALAERLS